MQTVAFTLGVLKAAGGFGAVEGYDPSCTTLTSLLLSANPS